MKLKPRKLSDEELVGACVARAEQGSTFVNLNLKKEREETTLYYQGKKPYPLRDGGSKFVSQDVYEAVEAQKAQITEAFSAGSNIVQFAPTNAKDVSLAKQASEYCEFVVFRQNDGDQVINGIVHDSAMHRVGVAKCYWDASEVTTSHEYEVGSEEEVHALLADPSVTVTAKPVSRTDPETGVVTLEGTFDRVEDTSQIRIEVIPPEEFLIAGRFTDLARAPYCAHQYIATLGELVDAGYDPDVVYTITGSEIDLSLDEERQLRDGELLDIAFDNDSEDEAGRLCTVTESYIRIDAEGTGRQQLWRVVHVDRTILDKAKVADHPFVTYSMLPEPHSFFGGNYAHRTIQHANTKTTLVRAIIEQAVEATNPRWQVAKGGVPNPRELIDNRRGGIVNVRDVNTSVAPLPQTPINPFVLQTIGLVDQAREDTTGISRLSQGLDKKALSHQNSKGLVEQLTSNSQVRSKVMARHFASQFLTKLYLKVYALGIEHDRPRILEIAGSYQEVTPQQWRRRTDVRVDMTLGYDERAAQAEELMTYDRYMSQNHPRLYDDAKAFKTVSRVLEIKGHKNVQDYLIDPATLPPPQPDPKAQAELAKLQKEVEVTEREIALKEASFKHKQSMETFEAQLREVAQEAEIRLKDRDASRKDAETENRIDVSQAELELAAWQATATPPENAKTSAIISPNG